MRSSRIPVRTAPARAPDRARKNDQRAHHLGHRATAAPPRIPIVLTGNQRNISARLARHTPTCAVDTSRWASRAPARANPDRRPTADPHPSPSPRLEPMRASELQTAASRFPPPPRPMPTLSEAARPAGAKARTPGSSSPPLARLARRQPYDKTQTRQARQTSSSYGSDHRAAGVTNAGSNGSPSRISPIQRRFKRTRLLRFAKLRLQIRKLPFALTFQRAIYFSQ